MLHHDVPRTNPFRTLGSREIYRNPWIRLREDEVVRPDGSPGIYSVVETKLACGVLALTADDEVVLVGQYRYPLGRFEWEIVEGGAEHGEDGLPAIQRELREEAGVEAATWLRLGADVALSNSFTDEIARLWVARDLTAVDRDPDPTEQLAVMTVPFEDVLDAVEAGEISDAMTVIAVYRCARLRAGDATTRPV